MLHKLTSRQWYLLFAMVLLLIILLSSCNKNTNTPDTVDDEGNTSAFDNQGCIIPVEDFSFSLSPDLSNIAREPSLSDLRDWEFIREIPRTQSTYSIRLITSRIIDKKSTELWIMKDDKLFLFDSGKDDWFEFDNFSSRLASMVTITTNNNEIWILKTNDSIEENEYFSDDYLFHRYNPDTKEFSPVQIHFPNQTSTHILDYTVNSLGEIWFIAQSQENDEITIHFYSFDPNTQTIERLEMDFEPYLAVIWENNSRILTMVDDGKIFIRGKEWMYLYDTASQEYVPNFSTVDRNGYGRFSETEPKLYFDSDQRLWIGSQFYLKFDEDNSIEPFTVIPSTSLIHFSVTGNWTWSQPIFLFDTSDHRIWFTSERGIGWVNPTEEKWCIFSNNTTASLMEDGNGNLWFIHDGKLYQRNY